MPGIDLALLSIRVLHSVPQHEVGRKIQGEAGRADQRRRRLTDAVESNQRQVDWVVHRSARQGIHPIALLCTQCHILTSRTPCQAGKYPKAVEWNIEFSDDGKVTGEGKDDRGAFIICGYTDAEKATWVQFYNLKTFTKSDRFVRLLQHMSARYPALTLRVMA